MIEFDLRRAGGVLHAYDSGPTGRADELVVFWHGGTPNTGPPPEPLMPEALRLGLRMVGADRPGYGGSTADPGAPLASVVRDVEAVLDHLGVHRFAVFGHSGGGPRVIATAGLLPARVTAAAAISAPAPSAATGFDRWAGMADGPAREQRAALRGRDALTAELETAPFDESAFTADDTAALEGVWSWFLPVVRAASAGGVAGQVDDGMQQAAAWGVDLGGITVPVLIVHGDADRMVPVSHGTWLAEHIPGARLRRVPGAGHISVLSAGPEVLRWLRTTADSPSSNGRGA